MPVPVFSVLSRFDLPEDGGQENGRIRNQPEQSYIYQHREPLVMGVRQPCVSEHTVQPEGNIPVAVGEKVKAIRPYAH